MIYITVHFTGALWTLRFEFHVCHDRFDGCFGSASLLFLRILSWHLRVHVYRSVSCLAVVAQSESLEHQCDMLSLPISFQAACLTGEFTVDAVTAALAANLGRTAILLLRTMSL